MSINQHLNHSPLVVQHSEAHAHNLQVRPCGGWQRMLSNMLSDGQGCICASVAKGENQVFDRCTFVESGAWSQPHLISGVLCDVLLLRRQGPDLHRISLN